WIWPVEHNSYGPAQSRIIMRPDGTRNVVITDHLGSTRLTFSTDAAPMQSQLHNAFGEVTSDVGEGARTGYIGREHDVESDLGFYGVRLYVPEYGRFMSTDPLWGMYITLQPYQYAGNNPVSLLDYSGREIDLSNLNNSISHGGEVSEVASEVKSGVIGDLTDITGLPLADNGQGKLVVAHGPVMGGSQTARELLTTAIESTETVYLSLGNIKKASQGGEFGGHSVVGINPFQVRDVINGARGGLDSRTMGFGMTFLHELSHTRLGGSLTDATSPGNPEGDVEKRMNVVRTELGASWGQRQTYVAVQDGNYYEIPFSKAGMLLNEAGKPPIGPSVRFTKTGWE
ncbi:MAG TPA: RHS repeat-associated core domain-containing protein, partial [Chlorobiota bacterium]|nr:RHS repeat-associated core domain-containing protein [Chlorobiota bacterium]